MCGRISQTLLTQWSVADDEQCAFMKRNSTCQTLSKHFLVHFVQQPLSVVDEDDATGFEEAISARLAQ